MSTEVAGPEQSLGGRALPLTAAGPWQVPPLDSRAPYYYGPGAFTGTGSFTPTATWAGEIVTPI